MIWPFKRRKKQEPSFKSDGAIPINNPAYKSIVTEFLEEARRHGETLQYGETFKMELSAEKRQTVFALDPMELLGPVMFTAHKYDLEVTICVDWVY